MAGLRGWLASLRPRRPVILMYHRVAEPRWDPWELAVRPARFAEQMDVLARACRPLSMDRLAQGLAGRSLPADAVAITFDDGYRDNLAAARPALERHDLPATVFLATGAIGSGEPFWWDELAGLVLGAPATAGSLRGGRDVRLGAPEAGDRRDWRAADGAGSARQALYLDLWRAFRALDQDARRAAMAEVRGLLGGAATEPGALPMTTEEVRTLAEGGLVSIGAHTVTHPALAGLPPERARAEIAASVEACRAMVGDRVRGFAYPYGDRSAATVAAVRAAGLAWACSTEGRAVAARDDRHDLPRFQVPDWDGETFARRLGLGPGRRGGRHV